MDKLDLDELARELRRRYQREWGAQHKDKIREYNRRWRQKDPEHAKAINRKNQADYWRRKALEALEREGVQVDE